MKNPIELPPPQPLDFNNVMFPFICLGLAVAAALSITIVETGMWRREKVVPKTSGSGSQEPMRSARIPQGPHEPSRPKDEDGGEDLGKEE